MCASLKRGPLADLSTPKDQKPGDQGKKNPGDLGRNLEVYQRHQKELKPGVGKT